MIQGKGHCSPFLWLYTPMHEVTPKVVAMAVSTVMTMWRIFPQIEFFTMMFDF